LIFVVFFCKMNSSLKQSITHSSYGAQHQDARSPDLQLKLHIEAQIGCGVLIACAPFTREESS
jgi:hypothetical protein